LSQHLLKRQVAAGLLQAPVATIAEQEFSCLLKGTTHVS